MKLSAEPTTLFVLGSKKCMGEFTKLFLGSFTFRKIACDLAVAE
jgi:hypothetical protein